MTLWIKSLEVENFAGIESAAIEFDLGLNICYGPNELGKSTLVRAIRAALLLQHTSAAADEFFDWHADAPPVVKLVFETEPQRIWRIRKSFGSGRAGYSYLEFSRDGQTFTQDAKGREVDGRLQELLQWGIEPPGGKGRRKRGLPESFITTALLGQQAEVTAILDRALDDDPDDSGKRRLTDALQALAEDPIFRAVFGAAQARVDEAYTATGRRKSGAGSPWVQLRDQLQAARDRQIEVNTLRQASESARLRITSLQHELLEAQSRAADADRRKRQIIEALEKTKARDVVASKLNEATRELERIRALQAAVRETQAEIATKAAERDELAKQQIALEERVTAAKINFDEAQTRVRELESGGAEQQRRIREQEFQKEILTLNTRESELKSQIELAQRIREKSERAEALRTELENVQTRHAEARQVLATAREQVGSDGQHSQDLTAQLVAIRFLAASKNLHEFETADATAATHRDDAERLREEALAMREEIEGWHVPSAAAIAALRNLETELRVAQEKLQVGLTATVHPNADTDLGIILDNDLPQTHHVTPGGETFAAKGKLHIEIPEFGSFTIQGGTVDLAAAAAAARQRWEAEARRIMQDTGCSDIAQLETLSQRAAQRLAEAQDLDRQAEAAAALAQTGGDSAARVQRAKDNAERFEASLGDLVPDAVVRDALLESVVEAKLDEAQLEDAIKALQATVAERRDLASRLDAQVAHDGGRLEGLRSELATIEQERDGLLVNFAGAWETALSETAAALADVEGQRAAARQQLQAVQSEAATEIEQARATSATAQDLFDKSVTAAREMAVRVSAAATAMAQLEGELGVQTTAADAEDETAARATVNQYATELDALPAPDEEVDQEDLNDAERAAGTAAAELRRLQLETREAEGALGQTGGQYIDEQAEQAREAVEAITAKEREVDLDYGAWSLLRDTLNEAESEDGAHLGNALVDPVSARMSALTAGRYGAVDIEPQLQTSGIEFGGASRDYDTLSIGTQEQLATLLRLAIAEALDSFIVMDDQLTQSDPGRIGKIREMLRGAAQAVQIIVFTCRAEDYVDANADSENSQERIVDLATRVIRRAATNSE